MNALTSSVLEVRSHLLARIRQVQRQLGQETDQSDDPNARIADLLDSMGMVELLALLAEDYGTTPEAIEQWAGRRFGTVAELAAALHASPSAALPGQAEPAARPAGQPALSQEERVWLTATASRLPDAIQSAAVINAALHRPAGWLESHAGIYQRRIWAEQDPQAAAIAAARHCLERAGVPLDDVGALLVTSEAPPLLAGLAASLHHRLNLRPCTVALEIGGACTGFLAALWTGRALMPQAANILIVALEAPSQFLELQPGPAGEAAALFGDAAAACLLGTGPTGSDAVPLTDVVLGADGGAGNLLQVERAATGAVELHLERIPLASRAVRTMAQVVRDLAQRHGLTIPDLQGVVAHGGNGRMPALLARQLALPLDRVWSETSQTGNLGSASLPVAWAAHEVRAPGPVAWTAVGAGLTWAAALTGAWST